MVYKIAATLSHFPRVPLRKIFKNFGWKIAENENYRNWIYTISNCDGETWRGKDSIKHISKHRTRVSYQRIVNSSTVLSIQPSNPLIFRENPQRRKPPFLRHSVSFPPCWRREEVAKLGVPKSSRRDEFRSPSRPPLSPAYYFLPANKFPTDISYRETWSSLNIRRAYPTVQFVKANASITLIEQKIYNYALLLPAGLNRLSRDHFYDLRFLEHADYLLLESFFSQASIHASLYSRWY